MERAQRAEREAVAAEAGRDELALLVLTDERHAVICFYNLTDPASFDLRLRQHFAHASRQPLEHPLAIVFLTGLHVLATEDGVLMIVVLIDPQVLIRIVGVPIRALGDRALRQASPQ